MITPIAFDEDNVVGMRIDGRIVAEDMDRIAALVEEKLARHDKLRVYVEVPSFEGISIEGFFKDLQLGLRHCNVRARCLPDPLMRARSRSIPLGSRSRI